MNAQTFVMPRDPRDAPMTEISAHPPSRAIGLRSTAKRAEDIVLAALALIAFALPMLLIALAIRLDSPGPILFRQSRTGRHERAFEMLKFRTMRHELQDLEAAQQTTRDDRRVTRLGAMLRRTSLDELPQLFNVLRGDMSLVGPRPALPEEVAGYDAVARRRLVVNPGITGLWQVSGRSDLLWEESLRLDLYYADNWRLVDDLSIALRTVSAVTQARGAY